jgi:ubiquinone/menaquinone biosynthesis C-methylase UbiE
MTAHDTKQTRDERDRNGADVDQMRHFYETIYYRNKIPQKPGRHERKLAEKIGINPARAVLDVACGTGEWLRACQEAGAAVAGIDLSETAIAGCRETMPSGEFHAGVAEELPFVSDRFDVVTCLGSLEHFVEPLRALSEMRRVARDGAQFLILVPNADFLTRKLGLYGGTDQVVAKEVVRTLEEWERLFSDAGLVVQERWKDLHVLSWKWLRKGKWHLFPVRITQALLLCLWPLKWQYQVFFLCKASGP